MNEVLIGRIADHVRGTAQILPNLSSNSATVVDGTTETLTYSGLQGAHHIFVVESLSYDFADFMSITIQLAGGLGLSSSDMPISLLQFFQAATVTDEGQHYNFPFPFVVDGVNALEIAVNNSSGADRIARIALHGLRLMPMEKKGEDMVNALRLAGVFVPESSRRV